MNTKWFSRLAVAAACALVASSPAHAQPPTPTKCGSPKATGTPSALIVYDAPNGNNLGMAYAIMQCNLLGHFPVSVDMMAIDSTYTAGTVNNYNTIFYMGSYYNNTLPANFLNDIYNTTSTVVWYKYNIWQLAWDTTKNFSGKFGFSFSGLHGLDGTPSSTTPNPGFFDTVTYQGAAPQAMNMVKYYAYDPTSNTVFADPDVGVTALSGASQVATITDSSTKQTIPYVVQSSTKNFWYVADMPFSYIGPRDRYLVMCDILYNILGVSTAGLPQRAMVRLEDVDATVDPTTMQTLANYLYGHSPAIPFSVAAIPYYNDPLGYWNGGVAQYIHYKDSGASPLRSALSYALSKGGHILMHGYTHQYDQQKNANTGVSADDFEFWNIVANTPDSEEATAGTTTVNGAAVNTWDLNRLKNGLTELQSANPRITPFAWETPHYESSPAASAAIAAQFKTTYQRAMYFTSSNGSLSSGNYNVGQFFPYIINSDYYGQRILPENLGNIEYNISSIDPFSNITYTWQDLATNANYAQMVHGGFASFFFHPFWLESDMVALGINANQDFKNLIQAIDALHYTWTDASTL